MIIQRNIYENIYCSETIRSNPFSSWCDKFAQLVSNVMKINQLVCGIKYRENRFFLLKIYLFIFIFLLIPSINMKAFFNALKRLEE